MQKLDYVRAFQERYNYTKDLWKSPGQFCQAHLFGNAHIAANTFETDHLILTTTAPYKEDDPSVLLCYVMFIVGIRQRRHVLQNTQQQKSANIQNLSQHAEFYNEHCLQICRNTEAFVALARHLFLGCTCFTYKC